MPDVIFTINKKQEMNNSCLKKIQTVAASMPIVLCSNAAVEAKDSTNVQLQQNRTQIITEAKKQNSADLLLAQEEPNNSTSKISQPQTDLNTEADKLIAVKNNNLYLPNKPEEVEVDASRAITLEQAVKLAIQNNKQLQEARLNLELSQQQLREAKAARYPVLNTTVDFSEVDSAQSEIQLESISQQGIENNTDNNNIRSFQGDLNLRYDLYTGGLRGATIQGAEKQLELAQLDLERINFETRFEVSQDYYSLQNTDSQVDIEGTAVDEAQKTLGDARLLKQAGSGTKFDVLRAEVELANAKQRLTTALSQQNAARRQLIATLDIAEQVELSAADRIEPAGDWELSLEETIIMAYNSRAELQQLALAKEINQKEKQIALAAVRPQVSLAGSYNLLDVYDDGVGINDGYSVGVNLQWNLFDGGAARARARQSETNAEINEVQFADRRGEVRLEVEQSYYSLTANKENIETSDKALESAQESLGLARDRFQAGVGTQTDVIQAQSELTTARANYLRSIVDYNQSLNQLERAVAVLPSDK